MIPEAKKFENSIKIYQYFYKDPSWTSIVQLPSTNHVIGKLFKSSKKEKSKKILLIGGVHGNETEGISFMYEFCKEFAYDKLTTNLPYTFFLIPILNPDGFLNHKRKNNNNVDLNRNLPTQDWTHQYTEDKYFPGDTACSELENIALVKVIDNFQPDYIISFHSWKPLINVNGTAMKFAKAIQKKLYMKIVEDIGYPTPGSLGTYTGFEKNIPTITLEFARGTALKDIYPISRDAILSSFEVL